MLSVFEGLALAAGREIMTVRAGGVTAETKSDLSPVTEADRRAEAVILAGLGRSFPGIPVIAEEEVAAGRVPDIGDAAFILVDPLDGTREFVSGKDDFTVNIALVVNGYPAVGVVYAPAHGRLWTGRPGQAETVEVEGERLSGRRTVSGGSCPARVRIVASASHRTSETDAFIARLPDYELIAFGSSLKFCLLAEGIADIYPRFGRTMEWDTAAGDAVLRAAGGVTFRMDGHVLSYGKFGQRFSKDFENPFFAASTGQAEWILRRNLAL
ncbi:3'(2'),5'-bisphosphate nucleotidase [Zhengella mangrovi]|uniref:3'(2'),5'-bisphosphate nucleotidase CysQ n=1 Tax=Zhengella mangrovi TaxID=1982044 RepID=A0A2G1QGM0_9HYPH|nr:3'(2'),5'-bisphosphate nucleotidase CysQ [Zhengella mangrovi]PHP64666.1 3'(2'),5'-bisphosphate nucleotidase [Zhengella mangrovi]